MCNRNSRKKFNGNSGVNKHCTFCEMCQKLDAWNKESLVMSIPIFSIQNSISTFDLSSISTVHKYFCHLFKIISVFHNLMIIILIPFKQVTVSLLSWQNPFNRLLYAIIIRLWPCLSKIQSMHFPS
jgi:hypothetical protein